jgi:predicted DNA-binding ribbon-helix-helix protein
MRSAVVKRSIVIAGHKTSVSLEDAFWDGLKEIGKGHQTPLSHLVADIDTRRLHGNLSSAIRLFVLDHYRGQISATSVRAGASMAMPRIRKMDAGPNGERRAGKHPEQ